MTESIECTPVGLQTNEGKQRVYKAQSTLDSANADIANTAERLIEDYGFQILTQFPQSSAILHELRERIAHRNAARDEFLAAVAGR
jgi:hypothetical protein